MRRICFYHAGCPDGLGAAWAVRQAWGVRADYRPRSHDDSVDLSSLDGVQVAYVDFAPPNDELIELAETAAQIIVVDHHVTSRDRVEADPAVANAIEGRGHDLHFDLSHSGAVLAWQYFCPDEPVPDLLRYVEDQDLWAWKLPRSHEVNAAIGSFPLDFDVWDELTRRGIDELARDGEPIGHELAKRAAFGHAWGCVYRVTGDRISASLYSIGDFDVSEIAVKLGGGGHRNAAGFSTPLRDWLEMSH